MDGNESDEQVVSDDVISIKKQKIYIKKWHISNFFKIIDNDLDDFFEYDHCCILADNYLIAMVFIYFIRASLSPSEYTPYNFFIALYLANIMEEDDDVVYTNLQTWGASKAKDSVEESNFIKNRDKFFGKMNYRCAVSLNCCEVIMTFANPHHIVWKRKRHVNHSGAISEYYRKNNSCPNCLVSEINSSFGESEKISDTVKTEDITYVNTLRKTVY